MLTYSIIAYVNKNRNTLQLQHSSLIKTVIQEGKQFPEFFVVVAALNKAVLFTTLQHFTCFRSSRF